MHSHPAGDGLKPVVFIEPEVLYEASTLFLHADCTTAIENTYFLCKIITFFMLRSLQNIYTVINVHANVVHLLNLH